MKVLIVEDEEMLNNIIAKRLKVESMIVDQCYNGEVWIRLYLYVQL